MARIQALFPTLIYRARLKPRFDSPLNKELLSGCRALQGGDAPGRAWSRRNYPGGYTSYGSLDQLHCMSSSFRKLRLLVDRHVVAFARAQHWRLGGQRLEMTDCWANIMGQGTAHDLHLHPMAVVSGTYYVQVPRGTPGLKFEDPRLSLFMATPPRSQRAPAALHPHHVVPARAGDLILFDSWLRHGVVPNPVAKDRVSISFNYHWR